MLNELAEYEQYTSPAVDFENHRLKYFTLIKKNFSGLERALTIIARRHIFEDSDEPRNFDAAQIKNLLRAWCGFDFDDKEQASQPLANRLPEYIRANFLCSRLKIFKDNAKKILDVEGQAKVIDHIDKLSSTNSPEELSSAFKTFEKIIDDTPLRESCKLELAQAEKIVSALQELRDKAQYFGKGVFGVYVSEGKNDYRTINYERVIANALLLGKLRRYYLVCAGDPFEDFEIKKFTDAKPMGKKLLAANEDLILKLTASRLLRGLQSSQQFVPLNSMNLINWLWKDTKPENFELEQFRLVRSKEKLFEIRHVGGLKINKVRVNPLWLKNFWLAEENELGKRENQGRIFFSDAGKAVPLKKCIN